jgi:hypothetical protein
MTAGGVIHQRDCGEPRGRIHAKALVRSIALDPARAYADLACTWARESSRSAAMRSSRRTIRSASMCPKAVPVGEPEADKATAAFRAKHSPATQPMLWFQQLLPTYAGRRIMGGTARACLSSRA